MVGMAESSHSAVNSVANSVTGDCTVVSVSIVVLLILSLPYPGEPKQGRFRIPKSSTARGPLAYGRGSDSSAKQPLAYGRPSASHPSAYKCAPPIDPGRSGPLGLRSEGS